MRLSREEILAIYQAGPDQVVHLVSTLIDTIKELSGRLKKRIATLEDENMRLKKRIKELEARLKMNSRNSSKPPHRTGF